MRETDVLGRTRETVLSPENIPSEARGPINAAPWGDDPRRLTLEQARQLSQPDLMRLRTEHPAIFEELKRQESVELTRRSAGG